MVLPPTFVEALELLLSLLREAEELEASQFQSTFRLTPNQVNALITALCEAYGVQILVYCDDILIKDPTSQS